MIYKYLLSHCKLSFYLLLWVVSLYHLLTFSAELTFSLSPNLLESGDLQALVTTAVLSQHVISLSLSHAFYLCGQRTSQRACECYCLTSSCRNSCPVNLWESCICPAFSTILSRSTQAYSSAITSSLNQTPIFHSPLSGTIASSHFVHPAGPGPDPGLGQLVIYFLPWLKGRGGELKFSSWQKKEILSLPIYFEHFRKTTCNYKQVCKQIILKSLSKPCHSYNPGQFFLRA